MKTVHTLVYTTLLAIITAFYFNILTLNPQLKNWILNNPFNRHHIDTSQGPISKPQPVEEPISNYSDTIRLNNIRALFRNGNKSRYVEGQFSEYDKYRERLSRNISKKFTDRQLSCISSISLIGWETLQDNVVGLTHTNFNSSAIDLAVFCGEEYIETVLYHEIMHALYFRNEEWFQTNLQLQWMMIDDYVSNYAATDLQEDIAETGAYYLRGDTSMKNKKFDLIAKFLTYTK